MRATIRSLARFMGRSVSAVASTTQQRVPIIASSLVARRNLSDNPAKSPYKYGAHRSNAEELVAQFPVTEVDGTVALCDGGGGGMGHPIEYIQLNTVYEEVSECKYCGLRYKAKHHH